jgi:cytochrome P450
LFPVFDSNLLWLFPKRRVLHNKMTLFLEMLDEVIKNKRLSIEKGLKNEALQDNERDLLSLMIESEIDGETMNDEELKVKRN